MDLRYSYWKTVLGCLIAVLVLGVTTHAADITWTADGDGYVWSNINNWDGVAYPNAVGDAATVTTAWPTVNNGRILVNGNYTIGGITLNISSSTLSAPGFSNSSGSLIFDNNGSNVLINASGTGTPTDIRFYWVPITLNDTTEFRANDVPRLAIYGQIDGTGGIIITGNATANEVYFYNTANSGVYTYTGDTRIESGCLAFSNTVTGLSSTKIVVNGTWDMTQHTVGYDLASGQTISGTGTIAMYGTSASTQRMLRTNGATISPGDDGIGTLTITGGGMRMINDGTYVFDVGAGTADQINTVGLRMEAIAGTVLIVDDGRTTTGTVPLIVYGSLIAGSVNDLDLILPSGWTATLVNSGSSIDLNITDIQAPTDTTPPSPNPMIWLSAPTAPSDTAITMTATTASDISGVEYSFECIAGGGNDSGWQSSPTYTDTGLTPQTSYTYRVKARDLSTNQNETGYSTSESATTQATPDDGAPIPPIAINFTIANGGYVTLVIEDENGDRVRNLISETWFDAGTHTAWWDGSDDHHRTNIGDHGNYEIDPTLVTPGNYSARGLVRGEVDVTYEFSVYTPNDPLTNTPWRTDDTTGQWLSDHVPPSAVVSLNSVNQMFIGSAIAEGAHGAVWTDLNGKKLKGKTVLTGWAGVEIAAVDVGTAPIAGVSLYGAGLWSGQDLVIVSIDSSGASTTILSQTYTPNDGGNPNPRLLVHDAHQYGYLQGMAARNGLLAVALLEPGKVIYIDSQTGSIVSEVLVTDPRGIAFRDNGLLVLYDGDKLGLFSTPYTHPGQNPVLLSNVMTGLDEPRNLVFDDYDNMYVSLHGNSHCVAVYDSSMTFVRNIGQTGVPSKGTYNPLRMNHPNGVAISLDGKLWVAEQDFHPKRISIWGTDGTFVKGMYGPTQYGGGGVLDPEDITRFYYDGMEFELDWTTGTHTLKSVFYRKDEQTIDIPGRPEYPVYVNGVQYMHNIYNGNAVGGPRVAALWKIDNGVAKLCAAAGLANSFQALQTPEILAVVPVGLDITASVGAAYGGVNFTWSDLDYDQQIDPNELTFALADVESGQSYSSNGLGLNVDQNLTFVNSHTRAFEVQSYTTNDVPVYDATLATTYLTGCQRVTTSGGDQVVLFDNGSIALEIPRVADGYNTGALVGETSLGHKWLYPSKWHGLHASQAYPTDVLPQPGEIVGSTRILGPKFSFTNSNVGEMYAINSNSGVFYVLTHDGLFVASLFTHGYFSEQGMPSAIRGMNLDSADNGGEGFYPTITQDAATEDIYLQCINHSSSIAKVIGLDSAQAINSIALTVTQGDLDDCADYFDDLAVYKASLEDPKLAAVEISNTAPTVDGDISEWMNDNWMEIDKVELSNSTELNTLGAMRISGNRLYVAYLSLREGVADNAGASPWQGMFKTGGGLDVMIAADPTLAPTVQRPTYGDQRWLTSYVNGAVQSILYVPVSTVNEPATFSSPNRSITFDQVTDVTSQIQFAQQDGAISYKGFAGTGTVYELSIPLSTLGLSSIVADGVALTGDLGVLVGSTTTDQRLYWSNKSTTLVQDAPSEAELKPLLWGQFILRDEPTILVEENFSGQTTGSLSSGLSTIGALTVVPALSTTGVASISNTTTDFSTGLNGKSLAIRDAGALWDSEFEINIPTPTSGYGVKFEFDVLEGVWNYRTAIHFSTANEETKQIRFSRLDDQSNETLFQVYESGTGWVNIFTGPFSSTVWMHIELRWDASDGKVWLVVNGDTTQQILIDELASAPETFHLDPGYRINYTNFKCTQTDSN